ncbi:MAG: hypothetical protein C3F13_14625 [Anaerolineales bacterium]|nr:hypothetical protein [Anaerolineae bacterium]PWB51094.1 MAG: hypothetical protein C3F13_14625 [Anaerolineales bacterium]
MLSDTAYHLILSILQAFMWDGVLIGEENLKDGAGVIVSNHMGAIGPVGLCIALPMRLYPWVDGATVDKVKGPENVRQDFVEKVLHIGPPLSETISQTICMLSTPLLLSVGCIPVPEDRSEQEAMFQTSISLLKQGKYLLVAPENPKAEPNPLTGITRFKRGFLRLGELYYQQTGDCLPFYPVMIQESGVVRVSRAVFYNTHNDAHQERLRMATLLEETIKRMYIEATEEQAAESFLFKHRLS